MSSSKKYLGGALAALLTLFAAVVVATPATAAEVEPLVSGDGYSLVANDGTDLKVDEDYAVYTYNGVRTLYVLGDKDLTLSNLDPNTPNPVVVSVGALVGAYDNTNPQTNNEVYTGTLTLDGVNIGGGANTALTIVANDQGASTSNIELAGDNTISVSGSNPAISLAVTTGNKNAATFNIIGDGSLNISQSSITGNAAIQLSGDTNETAGAYGLVIGDGDEGTPTVSVTSSSTASVCNITGSANAVGLNLTVNEGATFNVVDEDETDTVSNGQQAAVNLGAGTLTVLGSMSVDVQDVNSSVAGVGAAEIAVGNDDGANSSLVVKNQSTASATTPGAAINPTTSLTLTSGMVQAVATGGVGINGAAIQVDGGELTATSSGNNAITLTGGITQSNGSIIATSTSTNSDGDAIQAGADIEVKNGTLTATGVSAGISASGHNLKVSYTPATGEDPTQTSGPVVTASAGKSQAAIDATVNVTTGTKSPYYYWVALDGATEASAKILGYAGQGTLASPAMTADAGNGVNVTNMGDGAWAQVRPAPATGLETSVSSSTNGTAPGIGNGYVIANTTGTQENAAKAAQAGQSTNAYVYNIVVAPTGFQGVSADVPTGAVMNNGTSNYITKNVTVQPSGNLLLSSHATPCWYAPNSASGAETTISLAASSYRGTVWNSLYPRLTPESGVIPMSYQITFDPGTNGLSGSTAWDGTKDINKNDLSNAEPEDDNDAIYLTAPGTGKLVSGSDPTNENIDLKTLPYMTAATTNPFLSWYEGTSATNITNQVPQSQVTGWEENTTLYAQYAGPNGITYEGLTPTPVNVARGNSNNVTLTVTIDVPDGLAFDLNDSGALGGMQFTVTGPNGDAGASEATAKQNGVTITSGAATQGAGDSWTLVGVVSATSNASMRQYTASVNDGTGTPIATIDSALVNVVGAYVTIQGSGSVTQAISANGNSITLTANPAEGQTFEGWFDQNGKSLGTDPSIEVASGTTVTAVFSGETQPTPPAPGTSVRVYRLYNPWSGEHLYTTSQTESNTLDVAGWDYEGVAWVAPSSSTIPVYRLFNRYSNDHYYTTSTHEMNVLKGEGWTVDFGGAAAFYSATSSSVPVYCLFNPHVQTNTHLFTADYNEYTIRGSQGWDKQGPSFYALSLN